MLSSVYLHWKTKIAIPTLIEGFSEYLNFFMNTAKWTILFDWGFPLCQRELDFLESRNQEATLKFLDINNPDLSLELEYGITYKQALERIHAIKSDSSLIKDIEVFQEAYNLNWIRMDLCPNKVTNNW